MNIVWWSLMTKCFHITVEYAVEWMQTWMSRCQHPGMLRKPILCHICKHAVKFLEASHAQYLCRSAVVYCHKSDKSWPDQMYCVHTESRVHKCTANPTCQMSFLPRRWPSVEGSFFHSSLENSQLQHSSPVTSEQPKTDVGRKHEIYQPEDCLIYTLN